MLYAQARSLVTAQQNRRIVRQRGFCLFYGVPRASIEGREDGEEAWRRGRAESSEIYSRLNVVRIRAPGVPNYCFPDIRPPPGCRDDWNSRCKSFPVAHSRTSERAQRVIASRKGFWILILFFTCVPLVYSWRISGSRTIKKKLI